jgi:hypothetical protein
MKYSQAIALFNKYKNDPDAWVRIDDDTNGWNTWFLKEDILMCMAFSTTLAESFCAEVLHGYVSDNVGTVETAAKG